MVYPICNLFNIKNSDIQKIIIIEIDGHLLTSTYCTSHLSSILNQKSCATESCSKLNHFINKIKHEMINYFVEVYLFTHQFDGTNNSRF